MQVSVSLTVAQKRLLWTHNEVHLATHLVVGHISSDIARYVGIHVIVVSSSSV